MYSYVARQPIFNRQQKTVGYELLFRDGESNAFPLDMDENKATCRLLVDNFLAGGNTPAMSGKRCFINFPHQTLIELLPVILPKQQIVIEVLETCRPDDELLQAVRMLNQRGYLIALDDFDLDPSWQRFLPFVHIIKLDLIKIGVEAACAYVAENRHRRLMFLAEKVENHAEYARTLEAGFHFFQGYYFSRPELIKHRPLKPERLTTLRLLQEVCRDEVNFDRVEQLITGDVSLSYLLLRYVNTASQTMVPISGFRQALVYLGEDRLKMFVSAVATAQASMAKPRELYALSLQRGRMCELIAPAISGVDDKAAFMVGLLSLLDALLDQPLDKLMSLLPLEPEITNALLQRSGRLGDMLALAVAYEQADWQAVSQICSQHALSEELVRHSYNSALAWSSQYLAATPSA